MLKSLINWFLSCNHKAYNILIERFGVIAVPLLFFLFSMFLYHAFPSMAAINIILILFAVLFGIVFIDWFFYDKNKN